MRRFVCVTSLLILGACGAPGSDGSEKSGGGLLQRLSQNNAAPAASAKTPIKPLPQATLAGGDLIVAGPSGYCVDPTTLDDSGARSFALIASCQILSGGTSGSTVDPMIVTVTTGNTFLGKGMPTPEAMAAEADAPLLGELTMPGFVAVQLGSGGNTYLKAGDAKHWRAKMLLGGRLVGLALYAPNGSGLVGSQGGERLRSVAAEIAQRSPNGVAPQTADAPIQTAAAVSNEKKGPAALLGRLFRRKDLP